MPDLSGQWAKNGPWRAWYNNGRLRAQGEFLDGRRDGDWWVWDPGGELIATVRYRHGRIAESEQYESEQEIVERSSKAEPERVFDEELTTAEDDGEDEDDVEED